MESEARRGNSSCTYQSISIQIPTGRHIFLHLQQEMTVLLSAGGRKTFSSCLATSQPKINCHSSANENPIILQALSFPLLDFFNYFFNNSSSQFSLLLIKEFFFFALPDLHVVYHIYICPRLQFFPDAK